MFGTVSTDFERVSNLRCCIRDVIKSLAADCLDIKLSLGGGGKWRSKGTSCLTFSCPIREYFWPV